MQCTHVFTLHTLHVVKSLRSFCRRSRRQRTSVSDCVSGLMAHPRNFPTCNRVQWFQIQKFQAGWPDWASFRPLGDCLLCAVTEVSRMFCLLYSVDKFKHKFWPQKGFDNILGDFFHTLIWSPWFQYKILNHIKHINHNKPPKKTCRLTVYTSIYISAYRQAAIKPATEETGAMSREVESHQGIEC
jgi:hypothetical protein